MLDKNGIYFKNVEQHFTFKIRGIIILLILIGSPVLYAAITVPKQFESSNAATILGLHNEKILTEEKVNKAAKKLLGKYHPDKYPSSKFSKDDYDKVTEITKKINTARNVLLAHLKYKKDSDYDSNSEPSNGEQQESRPSDSPYSWEDVFKPSHDREQGFNYGNITNESFYNTHFEFLNDYSGFREAYLFLEGYTTGGSASSIATQNLLLIIRPETFPKIEVKVLSQERGASGSTQLIDSYSLTYTRGYHHGNQGQKLTDGIVFPDGSYLFLGFADQVLSAFHAQPIDAYGKRLMISTNHPHGSVFFLQMKDYYSTGLIYNVSNREYHEILPFQKTQPAPDILQFPKWMELTIENPSDPIQLPDFSISNKLRYSILVNPRLPDARKILNSALGLALSVSPENFQFTLAQKNEKIDFIIDVTTASHVLNEMRTLEEKGATFHQADAYSFQAVQDGNSVIIVRLLWDRLAYEKFDGSFVPREDAFARVAAALAHEIHGNVRTFSDIARDISDLTDSYNNQKIDQIALEVRAYEAGVKAITKMYEILMAIPTTREKTGRDLILALNREKQGLEGWRKAMFRGAEICHSLFH